MESNGGLSTTIHYMCHKDGSSQIIHRNAQDGSACDPSTPPTSKWDKLQRAKGVEAALQQWWRYIPKTCFNTVAKSIYDGLHSLICEVIAQDFGISAGDVPDSRRSDDWELDTCGQPSLTRSLFIKMMLRAAEASFSIRNVDPTPEDAALFLREKLQQVKQIEAYRHRIGVADYCGCLDEGVNLLVPGISASLRRPAHRVHQRPLPKAIPTENDAPEGQTDGLMTVSPAGTPRHNNSPKNKGQVAAALHRDSENKSISSEDGSLRQVQALGCTEERLQDWQPPCCTTLAISAEQCIKIGHAGQSREGCQAALKSPPLATAPSANQVLPGQVTDAQAGASVQALCAKRSNGTPNVSSKIGGPRILIMETQHLLLGGAAQLNNHLMNVAFRGSNSNVAYASGPSNGPTGAETWSMQDGSTAKKQAQEVSVSLRGKSSGLLAAESPLAPHPSFTHQTDVEDGKESEAEATLENVRRVIQERIEYHNRCSANDATVLPSPQNGSNSNHPESSLKGQQIWRQDGTLVKPAMFPRLRGGHKQSTAIGELLRLNRQRSCRDVTRSSEFQLVVRSVEGASQADVRHMPLSRSDAAGWQLQKQSFEVGLPFNRRWPMYSAQQRRMARRSEMGQPVHLPGISNPGQRQHNVSEVGAEISKAASTGAQVHISKDPSVQVSIPRRTSQAGGPYRSGKPSESELVERIESRLPKLGCGDSEDFFFPALANLLDQQGAQDSIMQNPQLEGRKIRKSANAMRLLEHSAQKGVDGAVPVFINRKAVIRRQPLRSSNDISAMPLSRCARNQYGTELVS